MLTLILLHSLPECWGDRCTLLCLTAVFDFWFCFAFFLLGYWHGPQEDVGSGVERKLGSLSEDAEFSRRSLWRLLGHRGGPSHGQTEQKEAVGHQLRMGQ